MSDPDALEETDRRVLLSSSLIILKRKDICSSETLKCALRDITESNSSYLMTEFWLVQSRQSFAVHLQARYWRRMYCFKLSILKKALNL